MCNEHVFATDLACRYYVEVIPWWLRRKLTIVYVTCYRHSHRPRVALRALNQVFILLIHADHYTSEVPDPPYSLGMRAAQHCADPSRAAVRHHPRSVP